MRGFSAQREAAGFTLLELILTMAIMATVTAVVVPNLRSFNTSQRLNDASSQLQSDLRQVQNSASSGLKCQTNTASDWYLELIKDAANNINSYNLGATCLNGETYSAVSHPLPAGVKISQIDLDACSVTNVNEMDHFKVRYGNIYGQLTLGGNVLSCRTTPQQITFYLIQSSSGTPNKVIINTGGAIYAQ